MVKPLPSAVRDAAAKRRPALCLLLPLALAACARLPVPPAPAVPSAPSIPPPAPSAPAASSAAPARCSIVLYGDSILHGGYAFSERLPLPPAELLKRQRPRYAVVDLSVNGETAQARAARFAQDVQERGASRFVVIAHGLNDATLALALEKALAAMVETAQAEGRIVILTGLSRQRVPVPRRDAYDATIRRVAERTGAAFADWGAASFRSQDMADVLHPAQPYAERLVGRIVHVLDAHAPECRS